MVEQRTGYDKLDELVFESKICCRIARRNTQFSIDGAQVSVDSTRADDQRFSNLGIGQSSCDQPQHLYLPLGQVVWRGWCSLLVPGHPVLAAYRLPFHGNRLLRRECSSLCLRGHECLLAEFGTYGRDSACCKGTLFWR